MEDNTEEREQNLFASTRFGDDIDRALAQFSGVNDQEPPDYSAIKIDGARAYDLARQAGGGQALPSLKPRKVRIDQFRRLDSDQATARFFVGCGTVSYTHLTLPTKRIV